MLHTIIAKNTLYACELAFLYAQELKKKKVADVFYNS